MTNGKKWIYTSERTRARHDAGMREAEGSPDRKFSRCRNANGGSQCLVINGTSFFSTGVASSIFFLFRIVVLKHHKRVELNSIELSRRYPKGTYN